MPVESQPASDSSSAAAPAPAAAPDSLVRAFLADRDIPCPGCGYNLRGCESTVCPECARPLRLAIDGAPRRSRTFYAGLVGLSVSAACMALTTLAGFLGHGRYHPTGPLLFSAVGLVITWLMFRSWTSRADEIDRLPRHKQQEQVALPWLWALLCLMVAAMYVAD